MALAGTHRYRAAGSSGRDAELGTARGIMPMQMARFYRIVRTNPPTQADFLSHAALGRPLRAGAPPALIRSWVAVSAFDSETRARAAAHTVAQRGRSLGDFIAVLEIKDDGPVSVEQSFGMGHFDLRGSAAELLASVTTVVPL